VRGEANPTLPIPPQEHILDTTLANKYTTEGEQDNWESLQFK
jgi:hypothetical protein